MVFFLSLLLLLQKDLRVMRRRKCTFIIELIFAIIFLLLTFLLLWISGKLKGEFKTKKIEFYLNDELDLNSTIFRVTYPPENPNIPTILSKGCPGIDFYSNITNGDDYVELNIKTFEIYPNPTLDYSIIQHKNTENRMFRTIYVPNTERKGNVFGTEEVDAGGEFRNVETKPQMLYLQSCINQVFAMLTAPKEFQEITPMVMPEVPPVINLVQIVGVLIALLFLCVVMMAVKEIVVEKETGIHAYLIAVGLPRPTFYLSHYIFAWVKVTFVSLVVFVMLLILNFSLSFRIFLAMICLGNVLVAFAITMASIFKRSLYVVLTLFAYVIGGCILYFASEVTCFEPTKALLLSLVHPQVAFFVIINHYKIAIDYRQSLMYFTGYQYYLPVVYPFLCLLLHFAFFMLLTFYIDYVVPVDDTPKLHPLFFLGLSKEAVDEEADGSSAANEEEHPSRHEKYEPPGTLQLEVKNLVKRWSNGDVGVDRISFTAHTGQVVALLGHNGAGKSTTFACLTGFLKPTSGYINLINGGRVGYCPQWDPLFPKLSVSEHLIFYCRLFTGDYPEDGVVDATLDKIELSKADRTLAKDLSGGMKRKLSLGIALISGARVILLDEPTAGIDTLSRRNMAKIIEHAKEDHAVVVTTHYMDEADAISDHINIMSHGKIVCSGSSEFLKQKYATGIILVVNLEVSHRENLEVIEKCAHAVLEVVKQHASDAEFYGPISYQFNILIQSKHRPIFPQMFEDLEKRQSELKIESFDVTLNTLDQVFVNVTKQTANDINPDNEIKEFIERRKDVNSGAGLVFKQIIALVLRKFHTFRRDYLQLILLFVALALIAAAIGLKVSNKNRDNTTDIDTTIKTFDSDDVTFDPESIDLDYATHLNAPIAIFDDGSYEDVKSRLEEKLKSMPDLDVRHYEIKENPQEFNKQYIEARFKLPIPAIFYLFTADGIFSLYNPAYKDADFFAQQLFYDAMTPGASITATIAFEPFTVETDREFQETHIITPGPLKPPDYSTMLLVFAYPILFAVPAFLYTNERVCGAVHLYARTSMKKVTYWAAALMTDLFILTLFNMIITTAIFAAQVFHVSCLMPYFLTMSLMSLAFLTQTYVAAQLFNSANVTFTLLMVYNIVLFMMLFAAVTIIKTHFEYIIYAEFLLPTLAMSTMFRTMKTKCQEQINFTEAFKCKKGDKTCDFDPNVLLAGTSAVHLALLVLVLGVPRLIALFTGRNTSRPDPEESPDVTKERERVNEGGIDAHAVVAMGLKKRFSKCFFDGKTVVQDVTFGVGKNECFGLLGPNGAGKSTTFNMLTATMKPTAGRAYVGGVSVTKSPEFGFCPQKESILLDLTVYETFLLFARLNGISETYELAQSVMNCLQLASRQDVLVRRCSGGEKRRVSIGIALITDPNILMLDEPTAGVDPHTRRFVWETLITLKNTGASMVLTSHSMEECEALCTRIAFLNKGRLRALGTSQHLKHVLGNQYILTVSLNAPNEKLVDELKNQFVEKFQATGENPPTEINLTWTFPKTNQTMSAMYKTLDEVVASVNDLYPPPTSEKTEGTGSSQQQTSNSSKKPAVRECMIAGATLEDIFVKLAETEVKVKPLI